MATRKEMLTWSDRHLRKGLTAYRAHSEATGIRSETILMHRMPTTWIYQHTTTARFDQLQTKRAVSVAFGCWSLVLSRPFLCLNPGVIIKRRGRIASSGLQSSDLLL